MGKMKEAYQLIKDGEEMKERLYHQVRSSVEMAIRLERLANDMKITSQELFMYSTANATELLGAGNQLIDWAAALREGPENDCD